MRIINSLGPLRSLTVLTLLALAVLPTTSCLELLAPDEKFAFGLGRPAFGSGVYRVVDSDRPQVLFFGRFGAVTQRYTSGGQLSASITYYNTFECAADKISFVHTSTRFVYPQTESPEEISMCGVMRVAVNNTIYAVDKIRDVAAVTECPGLREMDGYVAEPGELSSLDATESITNASTMVRISSVPLPKFSLQLECFNETVDLGGSAPTAPVANIDPGEDSCPKLPSINSELFFGRGMWAYNISADQPGHVAIQDGTTWGTVGWEAGVIDGSNPLASYFTMGTVFGHECVDDNTDNFNSIFQRRWANGTIQAGYYCQTRTIAADGKSMTIRPYGATSGGAVYIFVQDIPGAVARTCSGLPTKPSPSSSALSMPAGVPSSALVGGIVAVAALFF